jgi:hypothetical protein
MWASSVEIKAISSRRISFLVHRSGVVAGGNGLGDDSLAHVDGVGGDDTLTGTDDRVDLANFLAEVVADDHAFLLRKRYPPLEQKGYKIHIRRKKKCPASGHFSLCVDYPASPGVSVTHSPGILVVVVRLNVNTFCLLSRQVESSHVLGF